MTPHRWLSAWTGSTMPSMDDSRTPFSGFESQAARANLIQFFRVLIEWDAVAQKAARTILPPAPKNLDGSRHMPTVSKPS